MTPSEVQDIVAAEHRGDHRLWLRLDDGVEGELDFARFLKFRGMLAPLRDPKFFAKVFVHPEFGTVSWPGEIDLDTLVLYSKVTRRSIRSLLDDPPPRRRRRPARRRSAKV